MRVTLLSLILSAACSSATSVPDATPPAAHEALLTVVFPSRPADTLIVHATDTTTIRLAEDYVRTGRGPAMITGRIVRGAGVDARYPFHFVPSSVRLADAGMEICDGTLMRTAADVSQFFEWATGRADSESAPWCPWESRPVAVRRVSPSP